jgi:hypothetical protein
MAPWFGYSRPPHAALTAVARLNSETVRILALRTSSNYTNLGLIAVSSTPEQFSAYAGRNRARGQGGRASGARADRLLPWLPSSAPITGPPRRPAAATRDAALEHDDDAIGERQQWWIGAHQSTALRALPRRSIVDQRMAAKSRPKTGFAATSMDTLSDSRAKARRPGCRPETWRWARRGPAC